VGSETLVFVSTEERRGGAVGGRGESSSPSGPRSAEGPSPRPSRRSFSPEYKLAVVTEYENAPNGEKGAILRREGLYRTLDFASQSYRNGHPSQRGRCRKDDGVLGDQWVGVLVGVGSVRSVAQEGVAAV
jgi:hypothetical protein